MKFAELGEGYLKEAAVWLKMGRRAFRERNYSFAFLAAQEGVEFSLKGALRKQGVEHPRVHDVSLFLRRNKDRLPRTLADNVDLLGEISRNLALKRNQAAYGDEASGLPPAGLFSKSEVRTALRKASWTLKICRAKE